MKNNLRLFRQIPIAIVLVTSFSMCDDPEITPEAMERVKEYPALEGSTFTKTIPIFSQWDLSCGACNRADSLSNFNSLVPQYPGRNRYQCGHADAGCVAVAMGQVLYHWKRPGLVDWSKVKDTCSTRETAMLMQIIGKSLDMMYNVDQSGSSGIPFDQVNRIINAFHEFGFSAKYGDFELNKAINEIDNERPVILIAYSEFLCHAWISTAYAIDNKAEYYLFMNWGTNDNSWSSATEWKKSGLVFDRKKIMVYGITPL